MVKLTESSLDWALTHVERFGDTNIFPVPFEYKAIRHAWESDLKPFLRNEDILNWHTRPYRRCLTPKHRYGFRVATQLDPIDTIIFTALVSEIGVDIEQSRIPASKKISFSSRFKPSGDGQMYDPKHNYTVFQKHCLKQSELKTCNYIVLADIADFFSRIYSHPLENALTACTTKREHVSAIKKLLKSWNFTISVGIPIGQQISMLLAELVLDDVDRVLVDEGTRFCRYVDDYRIFCKTEVEAHEKLALLANTLYENHALTLQQHKTLIVPKKLFQKRFIRSEKAQELESLSGKLSELLSEIGVADLYEQVNYEDLDEDRQRQVDELNLVGILREQIKLAEIDIPLTRFVLRRLSQFDNIDGLKLVLNKIDRLYPVFTDVIRYIQDLRTLTTIRRQQVGEILLAFLEESLVGHLDFHRLWIFNTFTKDREWDNEDTFVSLYHDHPDSFSRRELILALGRARRASWFKTKKREIHSFEPWQRRAFIAAASCLPGDEFQHWFNSISRQLDPMEKAIGAWAMSNAF